MVCLWRRVCVRRAAGRLGGKQDITAVDSVGAKKPLVTAKSFIGRDGLTDDITAPANHTSDLFDMFKLAHIQHTDDILFPTDAKPLPPLAARKFNRALGIASATALSRGKRPYMEDMVCNVPVVADELEGFDDRPQACFFGVFDGHGG